ncbi:outer membrane protein, partial [Acidocella sp.]|uniref:outer membrane protein n=1 Tax=Acidocella sp. TaxID=50710 RepID=UPI00261E42D6
MKLRLALAAATCLVLPLAANAQPVTGPYVSLGAGTSIENPLNLDNRTAGMSGKMLFRPSYAGDIAVGYGFGDGFRVELNGDFYRNTAHKIDYDNGTQTLVNGGLNTYGPMVNVLYDMNVGLPIFPYVGAGIGYQWQKFDSHVVSGGSGVGGTRGSFAYNIIGGVAYPLPMVPGLSLTGEYKFTQLVESRNYPGVGAAGAPLHIGQSSSHTFLIGLRYQLFQPAPPAPAPAPAPAPVAAPAPAPAKTYLVFFDWDKYSLTPSATQIIA